MWYTLNSHLVKYQLNPKTFWKGGIFATPRISHPFSTLLSAPWGRFMENLKLSDFSLGLTNGKPWQMFGGREKCSVRVFITLVLSLWGCLSLSMSFSWRSQFLSCLPLVTPYFWVLQGPFLHPSGPSSAARTGAASPGLFLHYPLVVPYIPCN